MTNFIQILGFLDLVFIPIILLIVYVQSKKLSRIQKQVVQLSRSLLLLNPQSMHTLVGTENVSNFTELPPVNFSEGGMVSFADGVEAIEPIKMHSGFGVIFQKYTLVFGDFKDALLCSYLIVRENKCSLSGLIDFELN